MSLLLFFLFLLPSFLFLLPLLVYLPLPPLLLTISSLFFYLISPLSFLPSGPFSLFHLYPHAPSFSPSSLSFTLSSQFPPLLSSLLPFPPSHLAPYYTSLSLFSFFCFSGSSYFPFLLPPSLSPLFSLPSFSLFSSTPTYPTVIPSLLLFLPCPPFSNTLPPSLILFFFFLPHLSSLVFQYYMYMYNVVAVTACGDP